MYEFDETWTTKLDDLRERGIDPYPSNLRVTHTSTELHRQFADVEDPSADPAGQDVAVGGRVMFRNRMGRAMFLRIQDRGQQDVPATDEHGEPVLDDDGNPVLRGRIMQVYVRREEIGDEAFDLLKKIDIGDFLWARGFLMRTRTGELTVQGREVRLAGKVLTPFPDRWHSVTDVELRARQRYVDLFMNPGTRDVFLKRSRIVREIRRFFEEREFVEVETPMMQVIPGGAAARPFVTHHNALDMDLYLRIAPELYLKRLVVGGLERVFEINRSFRNEGLSTRHNPEFTMCEFYQAWATWEDLMDLTEELVARLVDTVCDDRKVTFGDMEIDFSAPFRRAPMDVLIAEHTGLTLEQLEDVDAMEAYWRANQRVREGEALPTSRGKWWEWLFEAWVEPELVNPTFVTHFPIEISPLSRRNDERPDRADRFELFVATWEIANAFNELGDPVDQAARFAEQAQARAEGDAESMYFDHDYVRALTYGLPPTAGEGIGIDRLVMLLTGRTSIREVILFPTLRPEQRDTHEADTPEPR